MAADAALGLAGHDLGDGAHALELLARSVDRLEVQFHLRRGLETRRPIRFDRHGPDALFGVVGSSRLQRVHIVGPPASHVARLGIDAHDADGLDLPGLYACQPLVNVGYDECAMLLVGRFEHGFAKRGRPRRKRKRIKTRELVVLVEKRPGALVVKCEYAEAPRTALSSAVRRQVQVGGDRMRVAIRPGVLLVAAAAAGTVKVRAIRDLGRNVDDGLGILKALAAVDDADSAYRVTVMRRQRAKHRRFTRNSLGLPGHRRFADRISVIHPHPCTVGIDRPKALRVGEVLVLVLPPRKEDTPVVHHVWRVVRQCTEMDPPHILPVGIHDVQRTGRARLAQRERLHARTDEPDLTVGQVERVDIVKPPAGDLPEALTIRTDLVNMERLALPAVPPGEQNLLGIE